ncbi:ABC transporter substrate-binding protein [Shouchella patagoniensis]|uniref:ABC transporter substrate-binding protein n=1 Tax=Shouchella patagoniensis TaxID=228576 RepID=UPI0009949822|nr:ABC transporter substrate-binding protein [Shouchella patagoniensis]
MKRMLFTVVGAIGLLVGCIGDDTIVGGDNEEQGEAIEKVVGTEVINLGFSGPLSGAAAFYGQNAASGLTMAINEINEAGGFEVDGQMYSFNLVTLDDQYLPNETGANARRLVQEYDTPIVYVPHSGGIFATQVFNEQEDFIIGAYSSEPDITAQGNELTLRIPPTYDKYVGPFSKYQLERFGPKLSMLPTNTQYGLDWAEELTPVWEGLGGEVVYEGTVDYSKDTDFFTLVTNALRDDPDVMFVGGASEPTSQVMQQARELGFEGGFLVMDQAKLDEMELVLGDQADVIEGSVGVTPLSADVHDGNEAFVNDYFEEHDRNPGSEAGYHYLSVYMLAEAMKAAGTVDDTAGIRANLNEGLNNIPEDKLIYPLTEVSDDGGLGTELRMAVVEDGEIKVVEMNE